MMSPSTEEIIEGIDAWLGARLILVDIGERVSSHGVDPKIRRSRLGDFLA